MSTSTSWPTLTNARAECLSGMRYAIGACVDGHYRIEGMLGQGGFGETYRALNTSTGQTVVLKLPQVAIIGALSAYNRYRREIEIGQSLDYPGLMVHSRSMRS